MDLGEAEGEDAAEADAGGVGDDELKQDKSHVALVRKIQAHGSQPYMIVMTAEIPTRTA